MIPNNSGSSVDSDSPSDQPIVKGGSGISIREMRLSDVKVASNVHIDAFDGAMNTRLGSVYIRRFLAWFVDTEKAVSLVGLHDDVVAGYVVCAPIGYAPAMNRSLLSVAAFGILSHPWVLVDRMVLRTLWSRARLLTRGFHPPEPELDLPTPVLSLVGIGVGKAYQGLGIGLKLVQAVENVATTSGYRALRLSVYSNNHAARRLYERAGWRLLGPASTATEFYGRVV